MPSFIKFSSAWWELTQDEAVRLSGAIPTVSMFIKDGDIATSTLNWSCALISPIVQQLERQHLHMFLISIANLYLTYVLIRSCFAYCACILLHASNVSSIGRDMGVLAWLVDVLLSMVSGVRC